MKANLPRRQDPIASLVVKTKWDPENLFHVNKNIVPRTQESCH